MCSCNLIPSAVSTIRHGLRSLIYLAEHLAKCRPSLWWQFDVFHVDVLDSQGRDVLTISLLHRQYTIVYISQLIGLHLERQVVILNVDKVNTSYRNDKVIQC